MESAPPDECRLREQDLHENQTFTASVLDSLAHSIAVLDSRGVIVIVNRSWRDFARDNGARDDVVSAVGINYLNACKASLANAAEPDAFAALSGIREVLAGTKAQFSLEYACHSPTEQRWFIMHATALHGQFPGAVIAHENITRRKLAEIQLYRSTQLTQQKLDELVRLNSRLDETNNKLLHSEKLASIGQLAAGMAHEINNPIGYVSSNLNSLADYIRTLLDINEAYAAVESRVALSWPDVFESVRRIKEQRDHEFIVADIQNLLEESREGLEHVRKIVQDLKDFSRAGDTGWQRVDIHHGLESTLNIVWNEIKYKADIEKHYGDLPEILCIPSQLNQVFLNLLTNAAQAIEERGHIVLRSGRSESDVWIEVEDNGCGIPPEDLERVFEPFYTTKAVGKGTGLGLSLSWGIVQRHRGKIDVSSELGRGTIFRVTLPIDQTCGTDIPVETAT